VAEFVGGLPTARVRIAEPSRPALIASYGVTTRNDGGPDDEFWRRPAEATEIPSPAQPVSGGADPAAAYPGPPPTAAPPPGWRPPLVMQPPPPRQLPSQDVAGLDADESSARTLTYGIGLVAGAVLLVVMCLLCSRVVF
jgi:hypothetical protein